MVKIRLNCDRYLATSQVIKFVYICCYGCIMNVYTSLSQRRVLVQIQTFTFGIPCNVNRLDATTPTESLVLMTCPHL